MTNQFKTNRRLFLCRAALSSVVVGIPLSASAKASVKKVASPVLEAVQKAEFPLPDFESLKGKNVAIVAPNGQTHKATLIETEEMRFDNKDHPRPGYLRDSAKVVRFRVPDIKHFGDEIYQIQHPDMGKLDVVFSIVPDASGEMALEAIFN